MSNMPLGDVNYSSSLQSLFYSNVFIGVSIIVGSVIIAVAIWRNSNVIAYKD